jgi:hypothetical protein
LDEIAYMDGIDDVDTTIKGVTNLGGTETTGKGSAAVTSHNNGIPVAIRVVVNLKLCVYYVKHMERVQRKPVANSIKLTLVRSYQDQQRHEVSFKKTVEEPVINDKDWPLKQSRRTSPPSMEELGLPWIILCDRTLPSSRKLRTLRKGMILWTKR